jgi:hypothetical protein
MISSREQQEELDRWIAIHRNDGSQFDYCRQQCAVNGVKLLEPVNRNVSARSPLEEETARDTGSRLIIP